MNSKTHEFITAKAIELSGIKLTELQKNIILEYCVKPDSDENDHAYLWHFYNPATRKNYKGGRISALTKFIQHWEKSKGADTSKESFEELGRSIHFLEDLCTPVHSSYEDLIDPAYRLNQHMKFENLCDELVKDFDFGFDKELENMNYYTHNSLKTIGKSCAMYSSFLFKQIDDGKSKMEVIGRAAIVNGIKVVTGMLYRFNWEEPIWK